MLDSKRRSSRAIRLMNINYISDSAAPNEFPGPSFGGDVATWAGPAMWSTGYLYFGLHEFSRGILVGGLAHPN